MFKSALSLPPLSSYPERRSTPQTVFERLARDVEARLFAHATRFRASRLSPIVACVDRLGAAMSKLDDRELSQSARAAGAAMRLRGSWPEDLAAQSFAVIREASARRIGQRPHDVQLVGGYAMLRGMIAEMATGEGKTLAASLAAAAAALAGMPVHVVTVNAYLARRDAEALRPLYEFLGLTVGVVVQDTALVERKAAYLCDIVYTTNKDVAFDYMRDRLRLGRRFGNLRRKAALLGGRMAAFDSSLLRGLHFAIVDEADSVLIDEARTPLILADANNAPRDPALYDQALNLARALLSGRDYVVLANERRAVLLARGKLELEKSASLGSPWDELAEREKLVSQALIALHVMRRDEHFIVQDGRVAIVDEYTGRILPDRTWSDGLHEMVERKEDLALSNRHATRARMTYQRFFRRYRKLSGMTGTAREVVGELWRIYRLPVASIPLHRPCRRIERPVRGHKDQDAKWRALIGEVAALHERGAAILIGARTVAGAAAASARLAETGLAHVVLSAAQDSTEAEIVAAAGRSGAITVATNMAGRGTDIRPDPEALARGGLFVFMTEMHEAARIDRQLAGRSGRQGEAGEVRIHLSLDDAIIARHGPIVLTAAARLFAGLGVASIARLSQQRAERLHARMRRELFNSDQWVGDAVGFAGEQE